MEYIVTGIIVSYISYATFRKCMRLIQNIDRRLSLVERKIGIEKGFNDGLDQEEDL